MSNERRANYRCQVPTGQEAAILRGAKTDIAVQISEESASGFGVVTKQGNLLKVGQVLTLVTATGCCEVRVANLSQGRHETRVGLQRLRELSVKRDAGLRGIRNLLKTGPGALRTAVLLGLCAMLLVWLTSQPNGDRGGVFFLIPKGWASSTPVRSHAAPVRDERLALNFLHLDGLKTNAYSQQLKLSTEQQRVIGGIVEDTSGALAKLYDNRAAIESEEWSDIGMQVLFHSMQEIETVLTPEQRQRWDELRTANAAKQPAGGPPQTAGVPR